MYTFVQQRGGGSRRDPNHKSMYKCAYMYVHLSLSTPPPPGNIYICGFYRSNGYCKLDNFLDYFECMNKLKGKKVIWIGDINVDQNKINDLDYRKLDSTLKSFNMIQTIQRYTIGGSKKQNVLE